MTNFKEVFIYNQNGDNEIVDPIDVVGVEDIANDEWEVMEVESSIVKEYAVYDGVCRVKVDVDVDEDNVLEEVNRLDEEMW